MALPYRPTCSLTAGARLPRSRLPVSIVQLHNNRLRSANNWVRQQATAANRPVPQEAGGSEEEFVGIPPEEDVEVPGTYIDALNPNTKLGKAVRAAVDELNHLNALEMESLQQCDALLKKLGLKSSIMEAPSQPDNASSDAKEAD